MNSRLHNNEFKPLQAYKSKRISAENSFESTLPDGRFITICEDKDTALKVWERNPDTAEICCTHTLSISDFSNDESSANHNKFDDSDDSDDENEDIHFMAVLPNNQIICTTKKTYLITLQEDGAYDISIAKIRITNDYVLLNEKSVAKMDDVNSLKVFDIATGNVLYTHQIDDKNLNFTKRHLTANSLIVWDAENKSYVLINIDNILSKNPLTIKHLKNLPPFMIAASLNDNKIAFFPKKSEDSVINIFDLEKDEIINVFNNSLFYKDRFGEQPHLAALPNGDLASVWIIDKCSKLKVNIFNLIKNECVESFEICGISEKDSTKLKTPINEAADKKPNPDELSLSNSDSDDSDSDSDNESDKVKEFIGFAKIRVFADNQLFITWAINNRKKEEALKCFHIYQPAYLKNQNAELDQALIGLNIPEDIANIIHSYRGTFFYKQPQIAKEFNQSLPICFWNPPDTKDSLFGEGGFGKGCSIM